MLVSHFLLVVGAVPVPVHDVLVFIFAGLEVDGELELVVVDTIHRSPRLPIIKGPDYEYLVASMSPNECVFRWLW